MGIKQSTFILRYRFLIIKLDAGADLGGSSAVSSAVEGQSENETSDPWIFEALEIRLLQHATCVIQVKFLWLAKS